MRTRWIVSLAMLFLVGCEGAGEADTDDAPAVAATPLITQSTADSATTAFVMALRAGDASQAGAVYATDAVFISARGKTESQAAIAAFWAEAIKGGAGKTLELHPLKFAASGDMAWQLSHFTGGVTTPTGHVLAVFQRQADGSIKLVAQVSIPEAAAK
jgi:ketosteroid isomerase-like protein